MPTILEEAATLVAGPRQGDYGHPRDNFTRIASLWSAYLKHGVSPEDVCVMMMLLKIARGLHKRDSLVDVAGYARCIEMIDEPKETT